MTARCTPAALFFLMTIIPVAKAQPVPPAAPEPLLRLEADGPTSFVTALAFDPDGQTLYAAGFDKVVRVWTWDKQTKKFALDRPASYRVPIGPELQGAINALVVSPDGNFLAVAGSGVVRKSAGFGVAGMILPGRPRDDDMLLDEGRIYVYNTTTRKLTVLRGTKGVVLSMAFAPSRKGAPPVLVSTAVEYDREPLKGTGALRVWNVDSGKQLAAGTDQPNRNVRPGLAVWRPEANSDALRVAYAWGDGTLRVWDVDAGKLFEAPDGLQNPPEKLTHNNTLAGWPDQGKFVSGSFDTAGGQLRLWQALPGRRPIPENQPLQLYKLREDARFLPRALTLLSSGADGQPDYAALILRKDLKPGAGEESYSLRLVGLGAVDTGVEKVNIPLWSGGDSLPALAAAPRGRYLAVAGNKDHEIHIYHIADLLKGGVAPFQPPLRSVGMELPSAGFVRRGKDRLGLVLRRETEAKLVYQPREPNPGDLVFDFTSRTLRTSTRGSKFIIPSPDAWRVAVAAAAYAELNWRPDTPDLAGAEVNLARDDANRSVFTIRAGDQSRRITLEKGQQVTAYALLPPLKPLNVPILALAFTEDGLPRLRLYNGRTGEQIRQCSGHTDPIRSLAFSSDGNLLVSAGEDQTVCVWSLTNLDKIVAVHGQLTGVAVKEGKGGVEVFRVASDSPASGKLEPQDVIEMVLDDKKVEKETASPRAFYDALFMMKPGETVTLQRKGKPAVALKVGQGIDERKPLFSLFVTRGGKIADWEWVGWNPNGYYESSSADVENYIGWQINNTDNPEKPSSFAPAPEYRKRFYREGILRQLALRGNLSAALKDWDAEDMAKPRARPKLMLYLREANPIPDDRGEIVLNKAPITLVLQVDDWEVEKIDWARYQVVGGAEGLSDLAPTPGSEREWTADLKGLAANPGLYKIRARLRTKEAQPREWEQEVLLRYNLPAAKVEDKSTLSAVVLHKPATGLILYDDGKGLPELDVVAALTPSSNPKPCKAILLVNDKRIGEPRSLDATATTYREKFTASPGLNRVQVQLESGEGVANTSDAVQVSYLRPPRDVRFEDADKWKTKPSDKALVDLSAVLQSPLPVKAESVRVQVNLREFIAAGVNKIDEQTWRVRLKNVPLEEGGNDIRLWAANAEGETREPGLLRLTYEKPKAAFPPPLVEIIDPAKDTIMTTPDIVLRARITSAARLKSIQLIREGNTPLDMAPIAVDGLKSDERGVYELKLSVKLMAGGNNLRLEAVNEGGKGEDSVVVTYLKKPVRLEIDYLTARGRSERIQPQRLRNGKLVFDAPQALCVVHGSVYWDETKDDQFLGTRPVRVRGYVNGKRQPTVFLFRADEEKRRREFELNVLFTEAKNNYIEIELPELAQEASNPSEFQATCTDPNPKQFGHLLVIGTGKTNEETLIRNALNSIQGEAKGKKEFTAPAFTQGGRIYGPLTGQTITPDKVLTHLRFIRTEIEARASEGSTNDVLMVYYEGNEAVTDDGHFLRTDRSRYEDDLKTSALTVDSLEAFCADTMGAQVLLLDVARDNSPRAAAAVESKDEVVKRPGRTHVSVFRCLSWLDHLDAPADPRLLAKWEESTKQHARLLEVADDVGKRINKPLTYERAIPKSAREMPIGTAGSGG